MKKDEFQFFKNSLRQLLSKKYPHRYIVRLISNQIEIYLRTHSEDDEDYYQGRCVSYIDDQGIRCFLVLTISINGYWKFSKECGGEVVGALALAKVELTSTRKKRTRKHDFTDKQFGEWTAIQYVPGRNGGWLCECSCERKTKRIIPSHELKNSAPYSCGCKPFPHAGGKR